VPIELNGRTVRIGLWYDFRNPPQWRRPFPELYARTFEHIRYAERLGFDEVWTSEHHFIDDGYSPSLLPICAAIAAQTARVRIGTNVLLLPLHDPVRIAEDAATVDIIGGGRFDLGVALGYKVEEYDGFGIDRRTRAARMEEAVEVLRRSWTEGPFSFQGRFYRYTNVDVTPKPVQQPFPLLMGGFAPPAVRRAARLGDGLLAAANVIDPYLEELRRIGRDPASVRIAISLPWTLITTDPERAWAEFGAHVLYQRQRYAEWFAAAGTPIFGEFPRTVADLRERSPNLFVTPEDAVAILRRTVERFPVTDVYWWAVPPGLDPKATFESIELAARYLLAPYRQLEPR